MRNEHLATLIDYVHLNPLRAAAAFRTSTGASGDGHGEGRAGQLSIVEFAGLPNLKSPRKRRSWVEVARGLAQKELGPDTAATRRHYLEHLEVIAREQQGVPASPEEDGRTLHSTLRRGWQSPPAHYHDAGGVDRRATLDGASGPHRRPDRPRSQ